MHKSLGILYGMRESLGLRMTLALLGFLGLALSAQGEKSRIEPERSEANPTALSGNRPNSHDLQDQQESERPASRYRRISSRRLPLALLEEFRKDYPAAVEVDWQYQEVPDIEPMSPQSLDTIERILILRLDSRKYRVQGYNLGQYFAATYYHNQRQSWAVLNQCEALDADRKSAWQSAYPDWTCLAFTQISHPRQEGPHRILISRPEQRETLILTLGPDGKAQAVGSPKRWKRMRYARIKNQPQLLRLLITSL